MAAGQLEIGAELAQRVEGIFVEESERAIRHRLDLLRKHLREGRNRVFRRAPAEMEGEQALCRTAQMRLVGPLVRKLGEFRIG